MLLSSEVSCFNVAVYRSSDDAVDVSADIYDGGSLGIQLISALVEQLILQMMALLVELSTPQLMALLVMLLLLYLMALLVEQLIPKLMVLLVENLIFLQVNLLMVILVEQLILQLMCFNMGLPTNNQHVNSYESGLGYHSYEHWKLAPNLM